MTLSKCGTFLAHRFLALRFLCIGLVLLFITHQYAKELVRLFLPLYQWAVPLLESRFQILFLGITQRDGESFLQLDILLAQAFFIGAEYFEPVSPVHHTVSMHLGFVLQPMVIMLTVMLAWPVSAIRDYFLRLLVGFPLLLLVMLLDIPMQFYYLLWDGMQRSASPDYALVGFWLYWFNFLNGGGLLALSLACAVITISGADRLGNWVSVRNSTKN